MVLENWENGWLKASRKSKQLICTLYTSTLQEAFGECKPDDCQMVCSVLSTVVLAAYPISVFTIATLLGFDLEDVLLCSKLAEPLLILHKDGPVQPFHKFFAAFLTDPELCKDNNFYLSPPIHHEGLLIGCLKLMNNGLKEKMGEFTGALEYACASWDKHLAGTTPMANNVSKITKHLHPFLEQYLLSCKEAHHCQGHSTQCSQCDKCLFCGQTSPTSHCQ